MKKSWRTTLSGLVSFGAAIVAIFWPEHGAHAAAVAAAAAGSGLIAARDNKVSSKSAGIDKAD